MYQEIIDKKKKIGVIGLGYVGLPIALEFANNVSVIGFDINSERIELMKNKIDPSGELDAESFDNCDIVFTNSMGYLAGIFQEIKAKNCFKKSYCCCRENS